MTTPDDDFLDAISDEGAVFVFVNALELDPQAIAEWLVSVLNQGDG